MPEQLAARSVLDYGYSKRPDVRDIAVSRDADYRNRCELVILVDRVARAVRP